MALANTPNPPYYAVIFTSQHTGKEKEEYERTSAKMVDLANKQPGFLGTMKNQLPIGRRNLFIRKPSKKGCPIGINIIS